MSLMTSFRRKPFFRVLVCMILVALLVLPAVSVGRAQTPPFIEVLQVDLWPEYDQPQMLVIYHIGLPASQSLPAQITVRIPAASGGPNAVAVRQADGALINTPYDVQQQGEWLAVTLTSSTHQAQVEYYDPGLRKDGIQRSFVFTWPGDYATQSFIIQVQQPLGASGMQISPSLGAGSAGRDGIIYYSAELGAMPAGQNFNISLNYQKNDDTLTISQVQVQPSGPSDQTPSGGMDTTTLLLWIAAGLGVVLIVGGGLFYWQSGRASERAAAPARARRSARRPNSAAGPEVQAEAAGNVYCHNCGKRAGQGDRFCRTCGTPLRAN
jgi:hypothetical protein